MLARLFREKSLLLKISETSVWGNDRVSGIRLDLLLNNKKIGQNIGDKYRL